MMVPWTVVFWMVDNFSRGSSRTPIFSKVAKPMEAVKEYTMASIGSLNWGFLCIEKKADPNLKTSSIRAINSKVIVIQPMSIRGLLLLNSRLSKDRFGKLLTIKSCTPSARHAPKIPKRKDLKISLFGSGLVSSCR